VHSGAVKDERRDPLREAFTPPEVHVLPPVHDRLGWGTRDGWYKGVEKTVQLVQAHGDQAVLEIRRLPGREEGAFRDFQARLDVDNQAKLVDLDIRAGAPKDGYAGDGFKTL